MHVTSRGTTVTRHNLCSDLRKYSNQLFVNSIVAKFRSISTSRLPCFDWSLLSRTCPGLRSRFANVRPWRDFSGWLAWSPPIGNVMA